MDLRRERQSRGDSLEKVLGAGRIAATEKKSPPRKISALVLRPPNRGGGSAAIAEEGNQGVIIKRKNSPGLNVWSFTRTKRGRIHAKCRGHYSIALSKEHVRGLGSAQSLRRAIFEKHVRSGLVKTYILV